MTRWKRPVLLVAGIALTVCTVLALRFAWERIDGMFFASVSSVSTSLRSWVSRFRFAAAIPAWRAISERHCENPAIALQSEEPTQGPEASAGIAGTTRSPVATNPSGRASTRRIARVACRLKPDV